jgi:N-carbamoylputrescine amidase
VVAELEQQDRAFVAADIDIDANRQQRYSWGLFRDRRPELYHPLIGLDGHQGSAVAKL